MKITKTQLKQIIKEEMKRVNESLVEHNSDYYEDEEDEKPFALCSKGFMDGVAPLVTPWLEDNAEYMNGYAKGFSFMYKGGKIELARDELKKHLNNYILDVNKYKK